MNGSITLNSFDISSGNNSVKSIKIDNAPPLIISTATFADVAGAKLLDAQYGIKNIQIKGLITGTSESNLDTNIDTFKKNVSGVNYVLAVNMAGATRNFNVNVTGIDFGERQGGVLTFIAYTLDLVAAEPPYGEATTLTEVSSVEGSAVLELLETFTANGSAEPEVRIKYKLDTVGSLRRIIIRNESTGGHLEATSTWQNGDCIEFDGKTRTLYRNGKPINFTGVMPEYKPGENYIRSLFFSSTYYGLLIENATGGYAIISNGFNFAKGQAVSHTTTGAESWAYCLLPLRKFARGGEPGEFKFYISTSLGGTPVANSLVYFNSSSLFEKSIIFLIKFPAAVSLSGSTTYYIHIEPVDETIVPLSALHWLMQPSTPSFPYTHSEKRGGSWTSGFEGKCSFTGLPNDTPDWSVDFIAQYRERYL